MSIEGQLTSNGPNNCYGPPCCRGIAQECPDSGSGSCVDYCCCCDPCLHDFIAPEDVGGVGGDPCQGHCCKCVPKGIIARFTPDTETDYCREQAWIMWPEHSLTASVYSASIPGAGVVTISVDKTDAQECAWIVEATDLSYLEEILIDHRDIKCSVLPSLTPIDVVYASFCEGDCTGTVTFEQYRPEKLPFRRADLSAQAETVEVTCGDCMETCWAICVRRRAASDGGSGSGASGGIERHTFYWDADDEVWRGGKTLGGSGCREETLRLTEVDGVCYLEIVDFDIDTFEGDLISLNECSLGLNVEAEDEDGNWIAISCNQCSCWNYLCGTCRCTCPELCYVGGDGNTPVPPQTLTWDEISEGWVDGDDTVQVSIQADPDSCSTSPPCQMVFSGFESPFPIAAKCGNNLSASITNGVNSENGFADFKWRHAWCSLGSPCNAGGCDTCDQVPPIIYADVESLPLDSIENCGFTYCLTAFTMPLYMVRNPPGAAAEFSWVGYYVFSCNVCNGSPVNQLLQLLVSCDGQVILRLYNDDGTIAYQDDQLSITIPCASCDDPLEDVIDILSPSPNSGCCDRSDLRITFTE